MAELTDLDGKIIKQIEYYFSDVNLGRDKFLQEQRKLDEGWVTMETMLKFNRLKQLSDSEEVITAAIRKNTTGLVEVSEDGKKIRRSPDNALPEFTKEVAQELAERSVYAKGFPAEMKLDEGMEFFEKYGPVDQVCMRKATNKKFKGSCFAIFKSKEGAVKFMTSEDAKFKEELAMIKFYKEDYFKQKVTTRAVGNAKQKEAKKKSETDMVKEKMVAGSILKVEGLGAEMERDKLKEEFGKYGKVQWVDVDKNEVKLRFSVENEAKDVLAKMTEAAEEGVVKIGGEEVKCVVMEGEEEMEHWKVVVKSMGSSQMTKRKKPARNGHKAKKAKRV